MKLFAAAALLLFPIAAFAQWAPQTWGCETDMCEWGKGTYPFSFRFTHGDAHGGWR